MKRIKIDLTTVLEDLGNNKVEWKKTTREGLDLDYALLFPKNVSDELMSELESSVEYYDGELTKVKMFGKLHNIPRQQVAYGDEHLSYRFSGVTIPAKPWIPALKHVKDLLCKVVGCDYNFVLVNRYRSGSDHIGEHKDDEADLDPNAPIASVSLGQQRTFVLRHGDCRKKGPSKRDIPKGKVLSKHLDTSFIHQHNLNFTMKTLDKNFYNTILSLVFTPCGNYLVVGDIYGQITVFNLYKLMNPDSHITKQDSMPKNSFTVQKGIQINSLLASEHHLLVGLVGEIYGYDWNVVKNNKDAKVAWKIELPDRRDIYEKAEINCMVFNKKGLLYAGCGDNKIYTINVEDGTIVRTLSGHSDYIHSIFSVGNELVSGGEDGVVNIWDMRDKHVTNKIEPHTNDSIARPDLGKWIGAVCINDDWLLCGGGPKLSLWHFRSLTPSTIFPIEDRGIHVAEVIDDRVIAGGCAERFYNMVFNGDIVSQVPTSCVTVYAAAHQDNPYRALCIAGSSPKIDICSNYNYKDQVLSL